MSEKLGTLEALLDNLERNKNKDDARQTLEKLRVVSTEIRNSIRGHGP